MKLALALAAALLAAPVALPERVASARPVPTRARAKPAVARPAGKPALPKHDGAHARVAIDHLGDLRPGRDVIGRREEPLTAEEDTARQIEKLLRGPLRTGVTGLFVADARTGQALFAVNADDPLNPASNVKLISTATALELLGADYRYPTRLLGQAPEAGVVRGDVYLLGSYDPTLTTADLDDIAGAVAARGVTRIDGSIVVGGDATRDGIYRAIIPIEVRAGEPGAPPTAIVPAGMDLVSVNMIAKTAKTAGRPRLTYKVDSMADSAGRPRVVVTIGGTIGKGGDTMYPLVTRERTAAAAYALRSALHAHGVALAGDYKIAELGDFVGDASAAAAIPVELGRHDSARLADIIARVNKWSVNWLADRVIITAAALAKRQPPSMELALGAMYDWLVRHPRIARGELVVDTGSGLSYQTRISAHELVSIVRSAAGFAPSDSADPALAQAWLASLSVAGTDGTLAHRFRGGDVRGRIRGKTGTLATAIALSGVLDVDPQRPLAFALVTNGATPLSKGYVRRAHEQVVGLLCRYLARTQASAPAMAAPVGAVGATPATPGDATMSSLPEASSLPETSALPETSSGAEPEASHEADEIEPDVEPAPN